MRSFLIAAMFAAAEAGDCRTGSFSAVSQHMKGTGVMKQHVEQEGQEPMDVTQHMNISTSVDTMSFNMVERIEARTMVNNQTMDISVDQILNFADGTMTMRTGAKGQKATCKTMRMPEFMPKKILIMAMKAMEKAYTCKGSANGLDSYGVDFPPSWLPVPSPLEFHVTVDVDEKHLIHKEAIVEDVEMKGVKTHVESTMTFTEVAAGGPKAEDLEIPEEWGCMNLELDLDQLLMPEDRRSVRAFGRLRKVLGVLRAVADERKKLDVIV